MEFLKSILNRNFLFTVVVVAFAAYVYFGEYKKGQEDQKAKEASEQITQGFEQAQITKLELKNSSGLIQLVKTDGNWKLVAPLADRADATAVDAILSAVFREKAKESVAEGEKVDWALYGLDPAKGQPLGSMKVTDANGKSLEFTLGSVKAFDGNLYGRITGQNKAILLSSALEFQMNRQVKDLRLRKFKVDEEMNFDQIQIQSSIQNKLFKFTLKRIGDVWKVLDPQARTAGDVFLTEVPPLSSAVVNLYLEQVKNLRVEEYASEGKADLQKFSLRQPQLFIRLLKGDQVQEYGFSEAKSITGSGPAIYAISSATDFVGTIFRATFDNLVKRQSDFYDRKFPFQIKTSDAMGLKIRTTEFKAELKKTGEDWKLISGPKDMKPVNSKIMELLERFSKIEALDYLEGQSGKGLNPAKNEVVVTDQAGQVLWSLAWGETGVRKSSLSSEIPKRKGRHGDKPSEVADNDAQTAKLSADEKYFFAKTNMVKSTLAIRESNLIGLPWSSILVSPTPPPAPSGASATPGGGSKAK